MDKASGQYVDASKMHELRHNGKFYNVKGPLNITRPPQGYPVFIQAGASDTGVNFAAKHAEVVFAVHQDKDKAAAFATRIRDTAAQQGRNPAHVKVLPGISVIVGSTEAEARAKVTELGALTDPVYAMKVLSERLGHDLSSYPLDAPVPTLPPSNIMQGHAITLTETARRRNMTLRELRDLVGLSLGYKLMFGTPEQVADEMEDWFKAGAGDGFNLLPPWFPGSFDDFADHVVPVLQKRGLFHTEYAGQTLRDHLGLPRPAHPGAAQTRHNADNSRTSAAQ
jgi:FMN-dependent oxidoreductase (nitrilotriacetate monooxygenase family)